MNDSFIYIFFIVGAFIIERERNRMKKRKAKEQRRKCKLREQVAKRDRMETKKILFSYSAEFHIDRFYRIPSTYIR